MFKRIHSIISFELEEILASNQPYRNMAVADSGLGRINNTAGLILNSKITTLLDMDFQRIFLNNNLLMR